MTNSPEEHKCHNDKSTERAIKALRNVFRQEREELENLSEQEAQDKDQARESTPKDRLHRYADYDQMDTYPEI